MTELEDRIRRGLGANVSVSVDDLISAAAAGAQRSRRRHRWAVGVGAAGATLATTAAIAIATLPNGSHKSGPPQPAPPPPAESTEAPSSSPSVGDWPFEIDTDGSSVYLITVPCPGQLRKGFCENEGGQNESGFVTGDERGESTVSLWRYEGQTWTDLGEVPRVSAKAQAPGEVSAPSWLPVGLMRAGPGALVLPGSTFGELVVSGDDGDTWESWRLPWQPSQCENGFVPCNVAVTGEYVVAAAGTTWLRREAGSDEWEDVTPPERSPYYEADDGRYGLLALDDGTLIAFAPDVRATTGSYRVSTDAGSTWSDLRPNPGDHSEFDSVGGVQGSTAYATCWTVDGRQCGWYRSSDLVHWTLVGADQGPDSSCRPRQGDVDNEYESVVQVGSLTYAIAHVQYLDGHPARQELSSLDAPHDVRHVLRVSADGCRTWEPVLP